MADAMGFEAEVKCSADMFYGFFKNKITQLANHFPEIYKSIQVIKGDGPSVGSAWLWKMELGGRFITEKSEMIAVNSENKSITWNFLDGGDVMNLYRSFQIKLVSVTPTGQGSCLVKWSVSFENALGDLPIPTAFINLLHMISRELPSRILKQG
ncbi:major latex protein 146-like [Papaver somniferum]|uniref:major latex protein 146-like n=1 Tax=Papaver somniferum TaxID=3469 RepID=UPI000E705079|nr:major latex protein 146-like [Papaver somniferum]